MQKQCALFVCSLEGGVTWGASFLALRFILCSIEICTSGAYDGGVNEKIRHADRVFFILLAWTSGPGLFGFAKKHLWVGGVWS